jgi:argininosuccinate lyase
VDSTSEAVDSPPSMASARLGAFDRRTIDHMLGPMLEKECQWLPEQLHIDTAHAVMLLEQGIVTTDQAHDLLVALGEARDLAAGGSFPIDPEFDNLLPQIERFIITRTGADTGGRLHTGRSRIDLTSAATRLFARNRLLRLSSSLLQFNEILLMRAQEHADTVMPGWTHLQHAQPWVLGHYLMRTFDVFDRNAERLEQAYARTNRSALGGAALAGSGWPLDRLRVADLLGHDGLVYNSMDAGSFTSDWILEFNSLHSMLMIDAGRLAGDIFIWHSWEFGLAEVADAFCGTSSLMPQKKNAAAAEYVRASAGHAIGWLPSAMGVARTAFSTDCDIPFSPDLLARPADITWHATELLAGILETLTFKDEVMKRRAGIYWSTCSWLADSLVAETGLPFRTTHHIVARLVKDCIEARVDPMDVTGQMLDAAAEETLGKPLGIDTTWVRDHLDAEKFVATRVTLGSVSPAEMKVQIESGWDSLAKRQTWYDAEVKRIEGAEQRLTDAVADIVGSSTGSGS